MAISYEPEMTVADTKESHSCPLPYLSWRHSLPTQGRSRCSRMPSTSAATTAATCCSPTSHSTSAFWPSRSCSPAGGWLGIGLGLFGILSFIRLRSDQLTQEEVAYYFIALALGLVNGLPQSPSWLGPALSGVLVALMYAVDHPRLSARTHRQLVTLDAAYPDRSEMLAALRRLLAADVRHVVVLEVDLVRDVTIVDVRYRLPRTRRTPMDASTRGLERVAP
jgi:Domain of unknown function (DUF4956)